MIDYTKVLNLPVSSGTILANKQLTFPLSNVATTGELLNRAQVAHYGEMEVVVRGGNVKLRGSYHKHAQGGTNHGDFTFTDIQNVINDLAKTLQFDPRDANLNFIEVGVNIEVSTDPSNLIRNMLCYMHKVFDPLKITGTGYGRECVLQQLIIKVYNKSLQYGLPFHLLRFEVKVSRMAFLKNYGINRLTMDDLRKPEVYLLLQKMLLDIFNRILFFNPDFDIDSLKNQKDRDLVLQGRFPEYWKGLPRQRKSEQIKRFSVLTGASNVKKELADRILSKWEKLMIPDKLTTFQPILLNKKPDNLTTFNKEQWPGQNNETGQYNTTIKCYYPTCRITHVDISMQKEGSHLLSNTGLKWLKEKDPSRYEEIRRRLLPRRGVSGIHTKFEENEIDHLSKQIRNEFYNNLRRKSRIPVCQLQLF